MNTSFFDRLTIDSWSASDGRKILIKDMDSRHLVNSIKWLRRTYTEQLNRDLSAANSTAAFLQGEIATYCIDQDIQAIDDALADIDQWLSDHCPCFENMFKECGHRRLHVPFDDNN